MHFLLSLLFFFPIWIEALCVVVIGGGPIGLAAAIEAHLAGAEVVVVEKRDTYIRNNTLFLYPHILEFLEQWDVPVAQMQALTLRGQKRGFVLIKELEEGLSCTLEALHIPKIQGEFIGFAQGQRAAIIRSATQDFLLPYDLLIGADGSHSQVRSSLEIPCTTIGESRGALVMIPSDYEDTAIEIEVKEHADIFAKKVCFAHCAILFFQNKPHLALHNMSHQEMVHYAHAVGWDTEALNIEQNPFFEMENIAVPLRKAAFFADSENRVVIIGDAAVSTSFYQGQGINCAFKMLPVLTNLLQQELTTESFDQFDQNIQQLADEVIDLNLPLY